MALLESILETMEKTLPSLGKTRAEHPNAQQIIAENDKAKVTPTAKFKMAESYKCEICGKLFSVLHKFEKHKADHENYKNNGYHLCNKPKKRLQNSSELTETAFSKQLKTLSQNVKNAQIVHTLEKKSYKCGMCGKVYTEKNSFKNHKNNHKRNKKTGLHPYDKLGKIQPFKVNVKECESLFVNTSQKVNSVEFHSAVKPDNPRAKQPYKCPIPGCGKIFEKHLTYVNHKRNHALNKKTGKHLFFSRPGENILK